MALLRPKGAPTWNAAGGAPSLPLLPAGPIRRRALSLGRVWGRMEEKRGARGGGGAAVLSLSPRRPPVQPGAAQQQVLAHGLGAAGGGAAAVSMVTAGPGRAEKEHELAGGVVNGEGSERFSGARGTAVVSAAAGLTPSSPSPTLVASAEDNDADGAAVPADAPDASLTLRSQQAPSFSLGLHLSPPASPPGATAHPSDTMNCDWVCCKGPMYRLDNGLLNHTHPTRSRRPFLRNAAVLTFAYEESSERLFVRKAFWEW